MNANGGQALEYKAQLQKLDPNVNYLMSLFVSRLLFHTKLEALLTEASFTPLSRQT
jgi:hypothetical protein